MTSSEIVLQGLTNVGAQLRGAPTTAAAGAPGNGAPTLPPGVIGKVASPPRHEATSEEFCFWVSPGVLVEKTQIVRADSTVAGREIRFYGLVKEVYRESRQARIAEEYDRYDGDVAYEPPYESRGVTYAVVTILRTEPPVLAPPMEGSLVHLGGEEEARKAYNADEIADEDRLVVGLVRNGGELFAGPGAIDLGYLLGANGGHLNVTGVAGRGTKSSFLLHVVYLLLHEARRQQRDRPSDARRLRIIPIILNVKNFDLFHIDRRHRKFDPALHGPEWRQLKIDDPAPFPNVRFFAPQMVGDSMNPRDTGRSRPGVQAYSWSLADVIERGLFPYLFASEDISDENFGGLVLDLEQWLTKERQERNDTTRLLRDDRPQTFDGLLEQFRSWAENPETKPFGKAHHDSTWKKVHRRLRKLVLEGDGVLRRRHQRGNPLAMTAHDTQDPSVVDLSSLAAAPSLQRFVVATIFRQLVDDRTGSAAQPGLVYLVTLDELNRFAPRNSHDPITQLIEQVAAEMRSQGIILLGAQQQASQVSPRVVENAGLRALGKTGPVELGDSVWRFLNDSARRKAGQLLPEEKLLIQDSFREPMLVKIPFPAWALRGADAVDEPAADDPPSTATALDNP